MKHALSIGIAALALCLTVPTAATAAPKDTGMTADEAATTKALIERANALPVKADPKAKKQTAASTQAVTPQSAYGSYPTRKGVILSTSDAFKELIPTGHSAIIYSAGTVVESVSNGVVTGYNNWHATKGQAYGVTVASTTAAQDAAAANWSYNQRGKGYNWNYLDTGTRDRFYCSQLVWASFKDNFGIDLDTGAYLWAVHPMEFVGNAKTILLYRKA